MAQVRRHAAKVLYLYDILRTQTNENHPMSAAALAEELKRYGIDAERKSIYDDIEALKEYGADIECCPGRGGGYYVAERMFEDVELRLLVDAVQASKFITERKSMQLIRKLEKLTNRYAAQRLRHQLLVADRVKSMNESIYYIISEINDAINARTQITFRYFEYTVEKKKQYRHQNKLYRVSPFELLWDNENYYLIAYDPTAGEIRHYRVDRMENLNVTSVPREGDTQFEAIDKRLYTKKMFHMFRGREERVRLRLPNALVGVVIDAFGKDVPIIKDDPAHFSALITVDISPQFYGWVFGLGSEAEILAPESVRAEYGQLLMAAADRNAAHG